MFVRKIIKYSSNTFYFSNLPIRSIDSGSEGGQEGHSSVIVAKPKTKVKEPPMYRVLLHNDDYTPMDFVVQLLEKVFHFDRAKATQVMLDVHHKGVGICGTYPFDIADTKRVLVHDLAKEHEYPLKCTVEQAP